jgi:hypothetical protein
MVALQTRVLGQRGAEERTGRVEPAVGIVNLWVLVSIRVLCQSNIEDVDNGAFGEVVAVVCIVL